MLRIVLRHVTGSRATEVDVIPVGADPEPVRDGDRVQLGAGGPVLVFAVERGPGAFDAP